MFLFLNSASSFFSKFETFWPSKKTFPVSGFSRVPIIWRSVDLPAPLAPTIEIISLLFTIKSTPLSTCKLLNFLWIFFELRDTFDQTFIIVTHNDKLAELADRKLTMSDGQIV